MESSPKSPTRKWFDKKWLELNVVSEQLGQATKEKVTFKSVILIKAKDIRRVASHPIVETQSLLQLEDGANFIVDLPYPDLKQLVQASVSA